MANSYFTVSASNATFLSDIYAAMSAKYTTNLTLHTLTTTDYIFTLPPLCGKVVRINYSTNDIIYLYVGDAFVSGTTLTNSILAVSSQTEAAYSLFKTTGHLVLGTDFLMLNMLCTSANEKSSLLVFGKATNNDSLVFLYSGAFSGVQNASNCTGRNVTKNLMCGVVGFQKPMVDTTGKPYKMPIQFTNAQNSGVLLTNADNSPATIPELFACSWAIDSSTPFVGSNALITTAPMFGIGFQQVMTCGLLAEW